MTLDPKILDNSYHLRSLFLGNKSLPNPIADNLDLFVSNFLKETISRSPANTKTFSELMGVFQSPEIMTFYTKCVAIGYEIYTLIYDGLITEEVVIADLYPKLTEVLYSEFLNINTRSGIQVPEAQFNQVKTNLIRFVILGINIGHSNYNPFFALSDFDTES